MALEVGDVGSHLTGVFLKKIYFFQSGQTLFVRSDALCLVVALNQLAVAVVLCDSDAAQRGGGGEVLSEPLVRRRGCSDSDQLLFCSTAFHTCVTE